MRTKKTNKPSLSTHEQGRIYGHVLHKMWRARAKESRVFAILNVDCLPFHSVLLFKSSEKLGHNFIKFCLQLIQLTVWSLKDSKGIYVVP